VIDHLILSEYPAARGAGKEPMTHARRLIERAMMEVLLDQDLSGVMETLQERHDYSEEVRSEVLLPERPMTDDQRMTLAGFLEWIEKKTMPGPFTIVTTNHDVSVEAPLFNKTGIDRVKQVIDFGFDWRDPYGGMLNPRPPRPDIAI
jgi:hypothetical protein